MNKDSPVIPGAVLSAGLRIYDPERFNAPVGRACMCLGEGTHELVLGSSRWEISMRSTAHMDSVDVEVTFTCLDGCLQAAAVAVELGFGSWSVENHVLMPAAVYQGNRFTSRRIPYSPKLCLPQDIGADQAMIISDVPRLNAADGPSRIQERSGSLSVPCIGFHSPREGRGFLLLTTQGNELGDFGIGIEETRLRDKAVITLTSPLIRELHAYRICDMEAATPDPPRDFEAGDRVVIRFRSHSFAAPDIQALHDRLAEVRKPVDSQPAPSVLPFSECFALQEEKFNRDNFVPAHGYYSVGLRQNFLQDWQIGWTGGMISTYPLLFAGSASTRANVVRNFDWLFPAGLSPSGFFWDSGANGTEWFGGDIRKPHTAHWHLIRKSADAVYFIIRQFQLMEKLGIAVEDSWKEGTRGACEAFVRLWETNGQFGQFVDSRTGEIRVGGSTSAALAPAALAIAAGYFAEDRYLDVALHSAEYFYQNFTRKGITCGGPGDALQNPDSESAAAMVESYAALHDVSGDALWIRRATEAARQFSSWVVAYDFRFPAESMFGKAGIRTTGSVYANTQNKHSAPGICTLSGLGLLKIFRATGDEFALGLLRDIARGLPQYLPHPERPLGDARPGHMCERVNMTDWEGVERIGETLRMTTWAETSLMLTAIEIPGVYVRTDLERAIAFDHVEAEVVGSTDRVMTVRIHNPTAFPARVRLLVEDAAGSRLPLPDNALLHSPVVELPSGASLDLDFDKPITVPS